MNTFTKILRVLSNVQILSALIWAMTIIACSASDKSNISSILIAAAGFHVVLMTRHSKAKLSC